MSLSVLRLLHCGHFGWAEPDSKRLKGVFSEFFRFLPSSVSLPENRSPHSLQTNLVSPKLGIYIVILLVVIQFLFYPTAYDKQCHG